MLIDDVVGDKYLKAHLIGMEGNYNRFKKRIDLECGDYQCYIDNGSSDSIIARKDGCLNSELRSGRFRIERRESDVWFVYCG